jgi:hypothetical protein
MPLANVIAEALQKHKFRYAHEDDLQMGVAEVLQKLATRWECEVVLDKKNRLDFLVDGCCIEIKVDGSLADLTRQLYRYAAFEQIKEFLVVTTKDSHRGLPTSMRGKRITVVHLLMGLV